MDINDRLRANVRIFYSWLGSMALLAAGPLAGQALIDKGSVAARAAGVAIAVGAALPWGWVVMLMIRREDEFARRIHLTAIAIAFAGANIELLAIHWLASAGFLRPPSLLVIWFTILVQWFAAIVAAKRYYEREA